MSHLWILLLSLSAFAQEPTDDSEISGLADQGEAYLFQAEVSNLMDIIINSLYQHKEVFLRELISNSSDALDKVKFQALKDGEYDQGELQIKVYYDEKAKTLSVEDTGIGMSKQDLIEKLGTVAKSGTTQFIEAIAQGGDINLIGQFGVGFYSAFLAAEKVVVTSKADGDDQHIWTSNARGNFSVVKDPRGNTLSPRGSRVTLFLKTDAEEYLASDKIKETIKKFSEFVDYPIYLWVEKEKSREVPMNEEEVEEEEKKERKQARRAERRKRQQEEEERVKRSEERQARIDAGEEVEEEEEELPIEQPPTEETPPDEEDEDSEEDDGEPIEEDAPKKRTKHIREKVWQWEKSNAQRAIWLNDRSENRVLDYVRLYKTLKGDASEPLYFTHFSGEGEVEFKSIIFVPENAPSDLFDNYYKRKSGLRLYVRRVLITEGYEDLVPRYLNFLKGVIHSDDVPLNVSRENLQQHKIFKMISKQVVKKVINALLDLADGKEEIDTTWWKSMRDRQTPEMKEEEERKNKERAEKRKKDPHSHDDDEKTEAEKEEYDEDQVMIRFTRRRGKERYDEFWKEFGKSIKLGVMEDSSNRNKLARLLRFYTTKSPTKQISFDDYVSGIQDDQEYIYFAAGEGKDNLSKLPSIQKLKELNYEVILFEDPLDEYMMGHLTEYGDYKIKNIQKGEIDLGEESNYEKKRLQKLKEIYQPLTTWWKSLLGKDVERVVVSKRLVEDPVVISTTEGGYTSNMERISKSQAYANQQKIPDHMGAKKVLEINPGHPAIKSFLHDLEEGEDGNKLKDRARILYETALLNSGFPIIEITDFTTKMQRVLRNQMNISPSDPIEEPEVNLDEDETSDEEGEEMEEDSLDEEVDMKEEL